ncbi:MAG: hypothetical protein GYA14_09630 [Ignavibacteria bacterium]|nr:hypothetical protein [Ignavibacteria bacterium]
MRIFILSFILLVTPVVFFTSCEYYERDNPLDPNYKGTIINNLKINSFYISDPIGVNLEYSGGNNDGIINRGEKLKIFISLINLGNSIESNVNANAFLSTNSNIQITKSYLKFGNILPNQISEGDKDFYADSYGFAYIELIIDKSVTPNSLFTIVLNCSGQRDTLNLVCQPIGASIVEDGVEVFSPLLSGDHLFFRPRYKIKNIGTSMSRLVKIIDFFSADTNIIKSGFSSDELGDINVGETKSSGIYSPSFSVSSTLNFPYTTTINLIVEDLFGNNWLLSYNLTLVK